jgi:hypothetical protein
VGLLGEPPSQPASGDSKGAKFISRPTPVAADDELVPARALVRPAMGLDGCVGPVLGLASSDLQVATRASCPQAKPAQF